MSELLSSGLFIAALVIYARKAGRHRLWFTVICALLLSFLLLNAVLLASNYFTGNGITDAVLYTLTSNLSGAGTRKYWLPGAGLILMLVIVFWGWRVSSASGIINTILAGARWLV